MIHNVKHALARIIDPEDRAAIRDVMVLVGTASGAMIALAAAAGLAVKVFFGVW